jgi:hypothetical protein
LLLEGSGLLIVMVMPAWSGKWEDIRRRYGRGTFGGCRRHGYSIGVWPEVWDLSSGCLLLFGTKDRREARKFSD